MKITQTSPTSVALPRSRPQSARASLHARACAAAFFAAVVFLFLTAAVAAFAAPLNPRGVPEEAVVLVHIDLDAARNSDAATVAFSLCEASVPEVSVFKQLTGVDLLTDVSGVTLGVLRGTSAAQSGTGTPPASVATARTSAPVSNSDGNVRVAPAAAVPVSPAAGTAPAAVLPSPAAVSLAAIFRGRFEPQRIFAAANAAGCPTSLVDGYTFIELSAKGHPRWKFFLTPLGAKSIALLTDIAQAPAVIAAYRGTAPSQGVPAGFPAFAAAAAPAAAPVLVAFGEIREAVSAERAAELFGGRFPPPEEFFLLLADDGRNLCLRASGAYPSEAAATRSRAAIQGIVALLRMLRSAETASAPKTSGTSPVTAEGDVTPAVAPVSRNPDASSELARLLDALRLNSEGRRVRLELDYPAVDLAEALRKAVARKRAQRAKAGADVSPPGADASAP